MSDEFNAGNERRLVEPAAPVPRWLDGGGEMGERVRAVDWGRTPWGSTDTWSQSLRTSASICLSSRFPMILWWGSELRILYNDAYIPMLGQKHPAVLGKPGIEAWGEIWDVIGPMFHDVLTLGKATWSEDQLLLMRRYGFAEETYFTWSYSPIRDESGGIGGVFTAVTETTARVLGERRLKTLQRLGHQIGQSKTTGEACIAAMETLKANAHDVPFALCYLFEGTGPQVRLASAVGLEGGTALSPIWTSLDDGPWPFGQLARSHALQVVRELELRSTGLPGGPWPVPAHTAIVAPLAKAGDAQLFGFLVAGVSPRRALDEPYLGFFDLVAKSIGAALDSANAYDVERQRREQLEQLDRAKTAFFSNVSHELRTPLTLMIGPTEDALAAPDRTLKGEALELVRRNELRLLKLVNSLLDFARMEAGRAEASFQGTDLRGLTREVASAFSTAIERAGLEFVVDCGSLEVPTYVDQGMWEKVVLNLLSNALKFTFEGRISVRLRATSEHAELQVSDTGVGIPAAELPHLFERFRRVQGSRSRTHEGSGIGLALVSEIVKMHGGTVEAHSVDGEGTTFTVRIPLGKAHLDPARVKASPAQASMVLGAAPFVEEALRWLPGTETVTATDEATATAASVPPEIANARIIVADDNADMRQYLVRLLSRYWRVEAVADGRAALVAARREQPDLVLSDIMMPVLDGFGLLRELRVDPSLASTPVLLLSARAGEEVSAEGLEAGADDYLVKPFSSRELVARVSTHLQLHRSREHLELALKGADLATWDWNVQTGEFAHNARWAELRGFRPGEVPAGVQPWFDGIHPEDKARVQEALSDHFEGRNAEYSVQLRLATRDGHWIWVLQRGKVFTRDERGRPLRMAGTSLDITRQKRAEMEQRLLAEIGPLLGKSLVAEHMLTAFADLMVRRLADYCVIDLVDDNGEIRRVNVVGSLPSKAAVVEEFARLPLGSCRTPVLLEVLEKGKTLLFETVVPQDLKEWARSAEHLRLLRETEVSSILWVPLIGRDRILGGFCFASATRARQYGPDDLRLAEELARRVSLLLDNARLYRAAERAIAARDEVLTVAAHDLRNPLGTILLQAGLLQRCVSGPESPAALKASQRIEQAAQRMNRLIQDLLDIARVEAGQVALECAALPTREVAAEAVEAQRTLAATSSIELELDASDPLPDIFADRHRVLQVFENLIGNAMKFTPAGGRITVGAAPHTGSVLFYVRDTGPGVPAEEQPHLFDRFWQARRSRAEKRGAGLGLAIVKGIIEAHGGRVWIESAPGEGSTFYFTLPTTAPRRWAAPPPRTDPTDLKFDQSRALVSRHDERGDTD